MKLKRFLSLFLMLAVCISFASCGDRADQSSNVSGVGSKDESSSGTLSLPRLDLYGSISDMVDKKDVRTMSVKYEDGKNNFGGYASLKVQGNSSLRYAKKNYTIEFYKNINLTEKMPVDMGWGMQSKYCLKANWVDKTHSRNIVTANLVTEVQKKYGLFTDAPANGAIDGFPIEIYNNGLFLGIYTLNIPKDEWLFNMDKDNPNHIMVCGENWSSSCVFEAEPDFKNWELEVGEETDETLNKLKRLFNFVMNSSDTEFKRDFEKYLDLDSVLNYYIIGDFAYLPDNQGKNMLLVTYDGVKWYIALYDMDTSWGADWEGKKIHDYINSPFATDRSLLFKRLEENFGQEIYDRYTELRKDILTQEHVMKMFEDFKASIPQESLKRETARWGYEIPGYDIGQIKTYLQVRIPKLDKKYESFKG